MLYANAKSVALKGIQEAILEKINREVYERGATSDFDTNREFVTDRWTER